MNDAVAVAICIAAGLLVGSVAGRIVRSQLSRPNRPEAAQLLARPAASLVFTISVVIALVAAVGILDEGALDDLPTSLVNYLPRALTALVVLLVGNAMAQLAGSVIGRSAGGATGGSGRLLATGSRVAILAASVILAANQAGVDTTIVNLAAAALFAAVGLAAALLIGFGGRDVARQIAAGRAMRSVVQVGDRVELGATRGVVVAVHPVSFEVDAGGRVVVVPHADALDDRIVVERARRD